MLINDLRSEFVKGNLSKPDYIEKMHAEHKELFEYAELIKETDISKIEITDGKVQMTTREHSIKFIVDKDDARIVPIEILNFGTYEKSQMDMVSKLVRDRQTVLDVGGNIGWFSLTLAKLKKNLNIYAFEPIAKTFDYLTKNIQLNHSDKIKCFNFGFSNFEGIIPFYYYSQGSGNASMVNVSKREDVEVQECKVMRMDDFVRKNNLTVDFIKCDVEGAELLIFQGATEILQTQKPIIATEMLRKWAAKYDYHPNKIISLMSEFGYVCFTTDGKHLLPFPIMDERTEETNFFFLHESKHRVIMKRYCRN